MISLSLYERQGAKLEGEKVTSLLFDNVSGALLFETQKGRFAACCLKNGQRWRRGQNTGFDGTSESGGGFFRRQRHGKQALPRHARVEHGRLLLRHLDGRRNYCQGGKFAAS